MLEARRGGLYDELHLGNVRDRTLSWPAATVRISMNRPGSWRVWSQTEEERWVWREIWNHLHAGNHVAEAGAMIGAVAGLPDREKVQRESFAQLAAAFLDAVPDPDAWDWRSVWERHVAGPRARSSFAKISRRYRMGARADVLPTRARLWVASYAGEERVLVDQQNLRVWIFDDSGTREIKEGDALGRILAAASRLT